MNKELQLALNSFSRIEAALTCALMCKNESDTPTIPRAMLKKLVTDIKMTRKCINDKMSEATEIEMEDAYA